MAMKNLNSGPNMENSEIIHSEDSFWLQMMMECEEKSVKKLPSSKLLLVLGDNEAEKTSLISKLQGSSEKMRKGNGLEYHFLNVRDEYCENQTKLGVWILDGDPGFQRLLQYVIDENTLSETTVLLVASMTKPWDMLCSICTWVHALDSYITNLKIPQSVLMDQKSKVLERYKDYVEPAMSIYGSLSGQGDTKVIENNLGLEIIVVINRTEYMSTLQTEFGYEDEHFDFIQYTLRNFCLSYGAALFYVSVKEDKNCDLLLKYILHKVYAFPFRIPAMFLEKDSIFVPAGWDSQNKIQTLAEHLGTIEFSSPFEEIIVKPAHISGTKRYAKEIEAQGDQEFLLALQNALMRQPAESAPEINKENLVTTAVVQRNIARRVSRSPAGRIPQMKQESKLNAGEGDTVLHSFFKNLLNRRTSTPVDRAVGISGNRTLTPKNLESSFDSSTDSSDRSLSHKRSLDSNEDNEPQSMEDSGNISYFDLPKEMKEYLLSEKDESAMNRTQKNMKKFSEQENLDSLSSLLKKCTTDDVLRQCNAKEGKTTHPSLDQDDVQQLPEYFLSNPGAALCASDCCFQSNVSSSNDEFDPYLNPPLDRVKSDFNPPLRLLLEKKNAPAEGVPTAPIPNGNPKFDNVAQSSVVIDDKLSCNISERKPAEDPEKCQPSL